MLRLEAGRRATAVSASSGSFFDVRNYFARNIARLEGAWDCPMSLVGRRRRLPRWRRPPPPARAAAGRASAAPLFTTGYTVNLLCCRWDDAAIAGSCCALTAHPTCSPAAPALLHNKKQKLPQANRPQKAADDSSKACSLVSSRKLPRFCIRVKKSTEVIWEEHLFLPLSGRSTEAVYGKDHTCIPAK